MRERSVLHVLPHPGGGGETYVDTLEAMDGYGFERMTLAPAPRGLEIAVPLVRNTLRAHLAARGHDVVHVHGEAAATLCLPAVARYPSVVTFHGLNVLRRARGFGHRAAVANLRLVARAAGRVICVSQSELDDVAGAVGAPGAGSAVLIPNGVELPVLPTAAERRAARAELGVDESVTVALWIGSLDTPKEPEAAVRATVAAARRGAPIRLFVAGDGPLRAVVEGLARASPEAVSTLGFREDTRSLLAAADVFVLASRHEGLPFSLLEAMAMGLPSVVAADGGTVEAVGDAGIAVARGDSDGFADALLRLAAGPAERTALGRSARERVGREFRADRMIERTRAVYDELLRAQA